MKIINVTNNHLNLVKNQLSNTDAELVEVYSAGNTDVIFTKAPYHYEIAISNKHRAIKPEEEKEIRNYFFDKKLEEDKVDLENINVLTTANLIEISIPILD